MSRYGRGFLLRGRMTVSVKSQEEVLLRASARSNWFDAAAAGFLHPRSALKLVREGEETGEAKQDVA